MHNSVTITCTFAETIYNDFDLLTDDIDSNIEGSYATTVQARTQLAKASKSVKSRTSWVRFNILVAQSI